MKTLKVTREAGENMKLSKWIGILALTALLPSLSGAAEVARNFHAVSRLRVEYDSNIFQSEKDEQDSAKFIADIDLSFDVNREQMFLSLRYMPIFIYWDDRPEDDTDLNHAFDGTFRYDFTPRTSLRIKDTFRLSQDAAANPSQTVTVPNNDYIYNSLDGTLSYLLRQATRLSLAGRWVTLAYDEDVVADVNDYDIYTGGLTLRHGLRPTIALLGDLRYESVEYATPARDFESIYVGGGVEQTFTPGLLGSLRLGYQYVDYAEAAVGSDDNPYGDASLTYLPTPRTRISLVGSFSVDESTLAPYSSQERARIGLSLGYDFTAKLSGYVVGSYADSKYKGDTAPSGITVPDADENWGTVSVRLTYQLSYRNWLELTYLHTDLDSDAQRGYSRDRGGLGWVYKL